MRTLLLFCWLVCCALPGVAQVKLQRLAARSRYMDTGGHSWNALLISDSTVFRYSGSRGSRFDYNEFDYLEPRVYLDEALVMRHYSVLKPNNIDSSRSALLVHFDTMFYYTVGAITGVRLENVESCEYYPDGRPHIAARLRPFAKPGEPWSYTEFLYSYGNLSRVRQYDDYGPGQKNLYYERYLIRDAFGDVVLDSSHSYSPQYKEDGVIRFEYDGAGNYISKSNGHRVGQRFNYYEYPRLYAYYPDGKVQSIAERVIDSPGYYWTKDSTAYEYVPGVAGYTKLMYYALYPGNRPSLYYQARFHVNAAGQKDTLIEDWEMGRFVQYHVAEYNAFGNPTSVSEFRINPDGTVWPLQKVYYYYELYDAPLGVAQQQASEELIRIFPNPSDGELTIDFGGQALRGPVQVQLTNMMGQRVQQELLAPAQGSVVLRLSDAITPGVYTITVWGSGGAALYRGSFVRK